MSDATNGALTTARLTLDGVEVEFTPGESLYEISQRHAKRVPTLCYDPRLEAFGACRLCAVEVDGQRNPVASCTTQAVAGMGVRTTSARLEAQRKTLVAMVASENPRGVVIDPLRGLASQELATLAVRYGEDGTRLAGATSGRSARTGRRRCRPTHAGARRTRW